MRWYSNNVPPSMVHDTIRLRKLTSLAMLISQEKMEPYKRASILRNILWRPMLSDAKIDKLVEDAWRVIGFADSAPRRRTAENIANMKDERQQRLRVLRASKSKPQLIQAWNFDLDDNVFNMPTKIILFEKDTKKEKAVSTSEFARIREKIGKEGPWQNYEINS